MKEPKNVNTKKSSIYDTLKESILDKEPNTPQQKVVPIKESVLKNERNLTVFLPKDIIQRMKVISAENNWTLKEMVRTAIEEKWIKKSL